MLNSKGGSSNEKVNGFYGAHASVFFLNSCGASAIGVLVGGGEHKRPLSGPSGD